MGKNAQPFAKVMFQECLAAMGDSITWRPTVATSYPNLIGAARNFNVVQNAGIDGQAADAMNARFDRDILAWRPGAISIMAGTNDAVAGLGWLPDFETHVRAMVNRGVASGALVTLCTPPIARDARPLADFVDVLREIAGDTSGCVLFDVFERFSTYNEATLDSLYIDDVHLEAVGNEWIRDLANEAANFDCFRIRV